MKDPQYLSPTSMSKWAENPQGYYQKYLSDVSEPKEPQSRPMSVGSAFDAFVKAHLYEALFGSPSAAGNDPRFSRETIFEDQVDPHNRDWARVAGEQCFSTYRLLGALDGLMVDLGKSKGPPKFEMDMRGSVSHGRGAVIQHIPFRVKPDLHYVNEHGAFVILDWKVNGFCSATGASPTKGFVRARRSGKLPWTHDDCVLGTHKGLLINQKTLENFDPSWAVQCLIGALVCGAPMGSDFIAVVHQLACRPNKITVAEHVGHVSNAFQESTFDSAHQMWTAIHERIHASGCDQHEGCKCPRHVFRHLPLEDSIALCKVLDQKRAVAEQTYGQHISPALD